MRACGSANKINDFEAICLPPKYPVVIKLLMVCANKIKLLFTFIYAHFATQNCIINYSFALQLVGSVSEKKKSKKKGCNQYLNNNTTFTVFNYIIAKRLRSTIINFQKESINHLSIMRPKHAILCVFSFFFHTLEYIMYQNIKCISLQQSLVEVNFVES